VRHLARPASGRLAVQPLVQPSRPETGDLSRQRSTICAGQRPGPTPADIRRDLCKAGVRGSSPLGSTDTHLDQGSCSRKITYDILSTTQL
jgi:hypothetical protein